MSLAKACDYSFDFKQAILFF